MQQWTRNCSLFYIGKNRLAIIFGLLPLLLYENSQRLSEVVLDFLELKISGGHMDMLDEPCTWLNLINIVKSFIHYSVYGRRLPPSSNQRAGISSHVVFENFRILAQARLPIFEIFELGVLNFVDLRLSAVLTPRSSMFPREELCLCKIWKQLFDVLFQRLNNELKLLDSAPLLLEVFL